MIVNSTSPLLVVEDSSADFTILKRLIRKMDVQNPIYRCKSGDEALDLIYQTGRFQSADNKIARPELIILDLNLPGIDGRSVLSRLKQDRDLSKIPVVVFTTSSTSDDIEYCYQNGANGYMVKPLGTEALKKMVKAFVDYWLEANTLPFFVHG